MRDLRTPAAGTVHRVLRMVDRGTSDSMSSRRKQDLVSRGYAQWDGPGKIVLTDVGREKIAQASKKGYAALAA